VRTLLRRTRVRLTLAYTGVLAVALCAGAVIFWFAFSRAELGSIDASLRAQAQLLASGLRGQDGSVLFNGSRELPAGSPAGAPIGALLLANDGGVLDRAGPAPSPAAGRSVGAMTSRDRGVVVDTRTLDGIRQRVLVQHLDLGNGQGAVLVLDRPLDEYQETLRTATAFLAITVAVLVILAAGSGYWLAGRVFRPVRAITATARDLSEHSLDRRITLDLPPDELGELAATFNDMLTRLQAAFTSLQRFTADAAHELRAPLAALLADVEVTLRRPRDPAEYSATLESVRTEAQRLRNVADQLLMLARADAGALAARWQLIDIIDLIDEVTERWRSLAARRGIELRSQAPDDLAAVVDPDLVRRVLDNLIDNALRYTPTGGSVAVQAAEADARWRIVVSDTGPGVDPNIRPKLFDRFTRSDRARGRETGGAGLGLSLCAAIAAVHGGCITLDTTACRGSRFVVDLPMEPPDARARELCRRRSAPDAAAALLVAGPPALQRIPAGVVQIVERELELHLRPDGHHRQGARDAGDAQEGEPPADPDLMRGTGGADRHVRSGEPVERQGDGGGDAQRHALHQPEEHHAGGGDQVAGELAMHVHATDVGAGDHAHADGDEQGSQDGERNVTGQAGEEVTGQAGEKQDPDAVQRRGRA
jgi:heavy metal sensor kinase